MSVKEIFEEYIAQQEIELVEARVSYQSLLAMYSSDETHGGISPETLEQARVNVIEKEKILKYAKSTTS